MTLVYSKELDFIPKLQLSKSRRAVYYTYKDYLAGKLPKKYQHFSQSSYDHWLKSPYKWVTNNLYNEETKEFVVKNTKSVGKPKYWIINGQDVSNSRLSPIRRAFITKKLHDFYVPFFKDCPKLDPNFRYDSVMIWYIKEGYIGPDYDNLWIAEKTINDVLIKDLKILPDDNHKYRKGGYKGYEYRENEGFKIEIWKTN